MMLYTSFRAYKSLGASCFDCRRDAIVFGIIFLVGLFFPKSVGGILTVILVLGIFKNKGKERGKKTDE